MTGATPTPGPADGGRSPGNRASSPLSRSVAMPHEEEEEDEEDAAEGGGGGSALPVPYGWRGLAPAGGSGPVVAPPAVSGNNGRSGPAVESSGSAGAATAEWSR